MEVAQQNGFENLPGQSPARLPAVSPAWGDEPLVEPALLKLTPVPPSPRPAVFIGAVVAGNQAGLPVSTLNTFVGFYLGARVLYNLFYINITSKGLSFLRSLSFLASVVSMMTVFVKSGNALNKF